MQTTKDFVKVKLTSPCGIDPILNGGKLEAKAGEEFFTTVAAYISMTGPGWEGTERVGDYVSRDDLPAVDAGGMTAKAITDRIKKAAETV